MSKNAKRVKTWAFTGMLAISGLLSSCDNHEEKEPVKPQQPTTEVSVQPQPKQRTDREIRDEYTKHVRDSIVQANGGRDYQNQLDSQRRSWYDKDDIYTLEYPYTLGGVMDREVINAGSKIIENSYNKIVMELGKYHVRLDDAISQDSTGFDIKNSGYSWNNRVSKEAMCFIGIENEEVGSEEEYEWRQLVEAVDRVIDAADYGQPNKDNMHAMVSQIVKDTKASLIQSRKSIEKKYADYYLVPENTVMGTSDAGEGGYVYGYEDLNYEWYNGKYLITTRSVSVYDSKLTVDFFGEPGAKYELISLGEGKWQVVKTSTDGKVSKTHVFEDKKDFDVNVHSTNTPERVGESSFNFEPGYNYGVHVSFSQVANVQTRKKDWTVKLPQNVQQQVDSLHQVINAKEELENEVSRKFCEADSISRAMTRERFGSREL